MGSRGTVKGLPATRSDMIRTLYRLAESDDYGAVFDLAIKWNQYHPNDEIDVGEVDEVTVYINNSQTKTVPGFRIEDEVFPFKEYLDLEDY